jgi:hypothetical protein
MGINMKKFTVLVCIIGAMILSQSMSQTNTVPSTNVIVTGVSIDLRPVITVTMEPGHTYTLWGKDTLDQEWECMWLLTNMVVRTNDPPRRIIMEKEVNARTGFYWLQVDGEPYKSPVVNTNISLPPMPGES